tara:strand:- start:316 stop:834 length:519 start_codon:yes stop_codon:yes gene_type:complete
MESLLFYVAGAVSLLSTLLVVTRKNAAHALIYLIVSLLAVAVIFFLLGAPFAAALEVVVYAGAIMVLFMFVVMMLNLGKSAVENEHSLLQGKMWIGPAILTTILLAELIYVISGSATVMSGEVLPPKLVGTVLFGGSYLLVVELASILLLAALVGAYHLGSRYMRSRREEIN